MVMHLLDLPIHCLEVNEAKDPSFATALRLMRELRDQVAKKRHIDFATYGNHPEVSFYVVFKLPYLPTSLLASYNCKRS